MKAFNLVAERQAEFDERSNGNDRVTNPVITI